MTLIRCLLVGHFSVRIEVTHVGGAGGDGSRLAAAQLASKISAGKGSKPCPVIHIVRGAGDLASIPGDAAAQLASEISEAAAAAEKEKLKGNEQLRQGNIELAYGSYSRAIALAPDQAVYYGNRAAAAITLKQYKQAVADGLKVGPQDSAVPNAAGQSSTAAHPLADVLLMWALPYAAQPPWQSMPDPHMQSLLNSVSGTRPHQTFCHLSSPANSVASRHRLHLPFCINHKSADVCAALWKCSNS